jgi:hypothetical protein
VRADLQGGLGRGHWPIVAHRRRSCSSH